MICPKCGSRNDRVINSRTSHDAVRRRRVCNGCNDRFSTIEISCDSFKHFKGIHTDDLVKHLQNVIDNCAELVELEEMARDMVEKLNKISLT